jgi:hypothetical protein
LGKENERLWFAISAAERADQVRITNILPYLMQKLQKYRYIGQKLYQEIQKDAFFLYYSDNK